MMRCLLASLPRPMQPLPWLAVLLLGTTPTAAPGQQGPAGEGRSVALYGRWEERFEAAMPVDSPSDVDFWLTLHSPRGLPHKVYGFWDGGTTWRVRWLATEEGTWRFTTHSRPPLEGLEGRSGQFVCRRLAIEDPAVLPRGPLRVRPGATYLERADGTPFFWLGDTAWNGPLLASADDWETYLQHRQDQRFSVIQCVLIAPWRTAHADAEGNVAYHLEDGRLIVNPRFFQRMDQRMDATQRHGLVSAAVLLWTLGKKEVSPGQLPDDLAIRLARYAVARYQAHDVVWILAGDENYERARGQRWATIGRAVFPEDMPRAPVTLHPQGMQWHFEPLRSEKWLDFLGYQSGHGDDGRTLAWIHSGPVSQAWSREPAKPILNLEPPYEGHLAYQSRQPHSDYNVRRACYWSLMATPVAGLTYGSHGVWSWQTVAGVPQDHAGSGVAPTWREAIERPGSRQMAHLARLFTSLRWTALRPSPDWLVRQPAPHDPAQFVSVCATPEGDQALAYLPRGGAIELDPPRVEKVGGRARWFDPREGVFRPAMVEAAGRFIAPDGQDWVLVLGGG
jgi:hypothetical protein